MTKNFHLPVERAYLDSKGPLRAHTGTRTRVRVGRVRRPHDPQALDMGCPALPDGGAVGVGTAGAHPPVGAGAGAREGHSDRRATAVPVPAARGPLPPVPRITPVEVGSGRRSRDRSSATWRRTPDRPGASTSPQRTVRRGLRGARHVAGPPARKRFVDGGALIAVVGPEAAVAAVVDWAGGLVGEGPGGQAIQLPGAGGGSSRQRERTVERFDSPPTGGSRSAISSRRTAPLLTSSSSSSRMRTAGRSTTGCATPVSTSGRGCSSRRGRNDRGLRSRWRGRVGRWSMPDYTTRPLDAETWPDFAELVEAQQRRLGWLLVHGLPPEGAGVGQERRR